MCLSPTYRQRVMRGCLFCWLKHSPTLWTFQRRQNCKCHLSLPTAFSPPLTLSLLSSSSLSYPCALFPILTPLFPILTSSLSLLSLPPLSLLSSSSLSYPYPLSLLSLPLSLPPSLSPPFSPPLSLTYGFPLTHLPTFSLTHTLLSPYINLSIYLSPPFSTSLSLLIAGVTASVCLQVIMETNSSVPQAISGGIDSRRCLTARSDQ